MEASMRLFKKCLGKKHKSACLCKHTLMQHVPMGTCNKQDCIYETCYCNTYLCKTCIYVNISFRKHVSMRLHNMHPCKHISMQYAYIYVHTSMQTRAYENLRLWNTRLYKLASTHMSMQTCAYASIMKHVYHCCTWAHTSFARLAKYIDIQFSLYAASKSLKLSSCRPKCIKPAHLAYTLLVLRGWPYTVISSYMANISNWAIISFSFKMY